MKPSRQKIIKQIGAIARDVYKTLGSGFSEFVYDRAMQVGLRLAKIKYENQKVVELTYKGHYVGEGYPDLVVHCGRDRIVLELKAIAGLLGPGEIQQVKNYMRHLSINYGIVINFPQPSSREPATKIEIREISL